MIDYGTAWRILRISSLVDQIFIKAKRIRTLEEESEAMIDDPINEEYIGIVNYGIMSLIQLELGVDDKQTDHQIIQLRYDHHLKATRQLMIAKNHDYGEAWRLMNRSSLT